LLSLRLCGHILVLLAPWCFTVGTKQRLDARFQINRTGHGNSYCNWRKALFNFSMKNCCASSCLEGWHKPFTTLISSFRRDVDEIWALQRYYAASCGNCLQTFRDSVSVPFSRVKNLWKLFKKFLYFRWLRPCIGISTFLHGHYAKFKTRLSRRLNTKQLAYYRSSYLVIFSVLHLYFKQMFLWMSSSILQIY
jgi:hypothetical protein